VTVLPTPSQTVGPYFAIGLCRTPAAELVARDRADAVSIAGRVLDGAGRPVDDAVVEIWQADEDGRYGGAGFRGFGRCGTDAAGRFEFVTVEPGGVAGPDGSRQAPHIAVHVFSRGLLKHLLTRIYFPDEEAANAADPILSSLTPEDRATLVAVAEDGALRFDIQLQGDRQTVFFAV
jgi:protocatechuate 3,4-dioxygenase, alpha subunit